MSKHIDYYVSAVRYNNNGTRITHVKAHPEHNISHFDIKSKEDVVASLKNNKVWYTMYKNDGKWIKGSEIEYVYINGTYFIRTVGNTRLVDNLGELPTF